MSRIKLIFIFIAIVGGLNAQIGYSPLINELIQETNDSTLSLLNRQLSGDTSVTIDGNPYTIVSRYYSSEGNAMAAQWIYEQFEMLGYAPEFQIFNTTGVNVIASKPGSQFTEPYYIICAHYDDMPSGSVAPGADDNASGVCAVLEAARLLKAYSLPYSIRFIAFDDEEIGLIGSNYYANAASSGGDDIRGVINLDMIAWDSDSDNEYSISTNDNSIPLKNDYVSTQLVYQPQLNHNIISTSSSDHSPFWYNGYQAILAIEDWNDFNDFYHTPNDLFSNMNIPYFTGMTRTAIAALASLAWDFKMDIDHDPLASSNNTDDRIAIAEITSSHNIGQDAKQPRLYYKIENGTFEYLHPSNITGNTYEFTIPGQPIGTLVSYYIAAQDDESLFISSLPAGARGVDPPGTTQPLELFSYVVANVTNLTTCSETTPIPIYDLQYTYDTVSVDDNGYLLDLNVQVDIMHSYDGDIKIDLIGANGEEITLSEYNGGSGNHYDNTIFDDQATTPITMGEPPYDGSYIPEEPLFTFKGIPVSGNWILSIYDNYQGDPGNLVDWCVIMQYTTDITLISETPIEETLLHQNYPNPVMSSTTIKYELFEPLNISLKLYDMVGREVRTLASGSQESGKYLVSFNVDNLAAGRYFYSLETNKNKLVKSFTILK